MAKIKCNCCGDIIEGDKKGTYIPCSCGKCAIDETPYYYRIIGNFEDYEIIEPKETTPETKQMTLEEQYMKVFDYFGYENQRRKLNEEVQELNDEILLYEKGEGDIKNVITEMGDVCNIIREFMFAYDISQEEITSSMDDKMDRTIERINNNYYKKEGKYIQ